jgi:hypothetical protein
MTRNAIRLGWLLLGLAIFSAIATLPTLAQVSQSAAAADSSNAQKSQPPAAGDPASTLNVMPVAATRHGVPWQDANKSGPTGFSAPSGSHLSYFGGPIITNVQVVQVLYGSGSYDPQVAGSSSPSMGQFFGDFTGSGSGLITLLAQYNTNISGGTNQFFGNGTFGGLFQISPSGANNGSTINDAQIQSELLAQISAGNLPAPIIDFSGNPRSLYMIYFPAGKTLINPRGNVSCGSNMGDFCAYHGTTSSLFGGKHVLYGVMPDMQAGSPCNGVCGSSTIFGNYTSTSSHELVEAMTDADIGLANTVGFHLPGTTQTTAKSATSATSSKLCTRRTARHTRCSWSFPTPPTIASRRLLRRRRPAARVLSSTTFRATSSLPAMEFPWPPTSPQTAATSRTRMTRTCAMGCHRIRRPHA